MTRVVIFDATDRSVVPELSDSWRAAARAFRAVRRFDEVIEATSWEQALAPLRGRTVREVQFWGHGRPGAALIGRQPLPLDALVSLHITELLWLRVCAAFHGSIGKTYAKRLLGAVGCRVAAHTFNIGPLQSGLHTLAPGDWPYWSASEGADRSGILGSALWHPNTITCLHSSVPAGW